MLVNKYISDTFKQKLESVEEARAEYESALQRGAKELDGGAH